jgi:ketosteroid isomerase-like protein
MSDTSNRELCHALFDALEQSDVEGVARCYAPDMTMWWNVTGQQSTRDDNLAAIDEGARLHRRRTYDDRIINTFDDGFVVQYTLNVVTHDGSKHTLCACLVAEVRDGLITRLDEYLDAGRFARGARAR